MRRRERKAMAEGRRLNEAFFRDHPDRLHWVRPTLPHEFPELGPEGHVGSPVTVVIRSPGSLQHVALAISGNIASFPNDERFLAALWVLLRIGMDNHMPGDPDIAITSEAHASLLSATGHR